MSVLRKGEVHDFVVSLGSGKNKNAEAVRQLVSPVFLKLLKSEDERVSKLEQDAFKKCLKVCSARLGRLITKQHLFKELDDPKKKEEVFLNLNDEPFSCLLRIDPHSEEMLPSSQDSQRSDLEVEIPSDSVDPVIPDNTLNPPDARFGAAKRPRWEDLTWSGRRHRTEELYGMLKSVASENDLEPHILAAYLGKRSVSNVNKVVARKFDMIIQGLPGCDEMDVVKAIYIKCYLKVGRRSMTRLRELLSEDGVELPTSQKIEAEVRTFVPEPEHKHHGVVIGLQEALKVTVRRALMAAKIDPTSELAESISRFGLVADVKGGLDGSGKHSVYNSESSLAEGVDTSHFVFGGFALNTLVVDNPVEQTLVYNDPCPASAEAERPLFIVPGAEKPDLVEKLLEEIERDALPLASVPLIVPCGDPFGDVTVKVDFHPCQFDGKCLEDSTGLKGAYCTQCKTLRKDGKDPKRIKQWFTIDRTIDEVWQLFDDLSNEADEVDLSISSSDRLGLTAKPLTRLDLCKYFPITHSYIRSLDYFERLVYRINAGVKVMGIGKKIGKAGQAALKKAKKDFTRGSQTGPLHLKLDCPDATGAGGNTDTAQMGRRFFEANNAEHFIALVHGTAKEKEAFRSLHQNFSVILRVVSSKDHKIDVDAFKTLCQETYLLLVESFPWASVPPSIHRLLAHSEERIRLNDGFGLGKFTEEGLEATHKDLRKVREILARKTCLKDNIRDVFKYLFTRSDPLVRTYRKVLECRMCGEKGHTIRSCPTKKEVLTRYDVLTRYEDLLKGIFIVEEEEEV